MNYIENRIENLYVFSAEEISTLIESAENFPAKELLSNKRQVEEISIDFAWGSSQIEGNTYTRSEAIDLMKSGRTAGGKHINEASMILSLRQAFLLITKNHQDILSRPMEGLREIHELTMKGLLEEHQLGATRRTRNVFIGGSNYRPPSGEKYLEAQVEKVMNYMLKIEDPFSRSQYAASNIAYIQPFEDGNKRTSRLFQNCILINAGIPPLIIGAEDATAYIEAQVNYYETGDFSLQRALFIKSFTEHYPPEENRPSETSTMRH